MYLIKLTMINNIVIFRCDNIIINKQTKLMVTNILEIMFSLYHTLFITC